MTMLRRSLSALLVALVPSVAAGEGARVVDSKRLTVEQVVDSAPAEWKGVDLGPAPPPGATRVVTREEIARSLSLSGFPTAGLRLPASVRVAGASTMLQPSDVVALATPAVERALPRGATLVSVKAHRRVVTSPRAVPRAVTLAPLPRRAGSVRTTGVLELAVDDEVVERVPLAIVVSRTQEAARALLEKGARLSLVIERRGATIATQGVALEAADAGDVISFTVAKTGRVVRAKVLSKHEAQVQEGA